MRFTFECPYCGLEKGHRTKIGGLLIACFHFLRVHPKLSEKAGNPFCPEDGPTKEDFRKSTEPDNSQS